LRRKADPSCWRTWSWRDPAVTQLMATRSEAARRRSTEVDRFRTWLGLLGRPASATPIGWGRPRPGRFQPALVVLRGRISWTVPATGRRHLV
jgi:hypothetical protein